MTADAIQGVCLTVAAWAALGLYLEAIDMRLERDQANLHFGKAQYWFDKWNALHTEVEADAAVERESESWRQALVKAPDEKIRKIVQDIFAPRPNNDGPVWTRIECPDFLGDAEVAEHLIRRTGGQP